MCMSGGNPGGLTASVCVRMCEQDLCCEACRSTQGCVGWAFVRESHMCWMKVSCAVVESQLVRIVSSFLTEFHSVLRICWLKSSLPSQLVLPNVTAGVAISSPAFVGGEDEFMAGISLSLARSLASSLTLPRSLAYCPKKVGCKRGRGGACGNGRTGLIHYEVAPPPPPPLLSLSLSF